MDEVQDPVAPELDRYHHRRKSDHRRQHVPWPDRGGDLPGSTENLFGHEVPATVGRHLAAYHDAPSPRTPARQQMEAFDQLPNNLISRFELM
jgi:hypothetical protein